jgi:GxxExxY protein
MNDDERDPQTYAIIGAAMEVHRILGHGFLEARYQEALAIEFQRRGIPFEPQVLLPIIYKGIELETKYRADFRCYRSIMVELKAISALTGGDESQLLNYLKASQHHRGLLINFGRASLEYRRLVFGPAESTDE